MAEDKNLEAKNVLSGSISGHVTDNTLLCSLLGQNGWSERSDPISLLVMLILSTYISKPNIFSQTDHITSKHQAIIISKGLEDGG